MLQEFYAQLYCYISEGRFWNSDIVVAAFLSTIFYKIVGYLQPLPPFIWSRLKRQFLYRTTIEQSSELYVLLAKYIAIKYPSKMRNVEAFINESFGEDSYDAESYNKKDDTEIKYRHFSDFVIIRKGLTFIKIEKEREKLENAKDFTKAYMGRIILSGFFAKSKIEKLIEDSLKLRPKKEEGKLKRYQWQGYDWSSDYIYTNKSMDSIFFPEKQRILARVDRFEKDKDFYKEKGIEWYLGCLFSGKPGSGKTTAGKALAEYTGRNLYTMNLSTMTDDGFTKAFRQMGKNALLLLDDVDICLSGRESKTEDMLGVKLSTLLSSLDGSMSRSDLIVVMTTNNKEKLDHALVRRGRVSVDEEISYPDRESATDYVAHFFVKDKAKINITKNNFSSSMVDIEDICLNSKGVDEAVIKINEL